MDISIIIPVYKEAKRINALLDRLMVIASACEPDLSLEVIVSDGDLSLDTLCSIQKSHLLSGRIRCVKSPKNRGLQMNEGAKAARGRILLFLHADTMVSRAAIESIPGLLQGGRKAGAFHLGIDSKKFRYRMIEKSVALRTRLTRIPYGDQAFFIRRGYFFKINGFFRFPIMEDVALMQKIKNSGQKIVISKFQVKTSPRRWEKEGFLRCTIRNSIIISLYYLGIHPLKLVRYYSFLKDPG